MDFQTLARRQLQALCKLNKIPANITNVAMVEALSSLETVVGIEAFLNLSESSETNESSVESPAKTEIMSPRVPRTGYRTSTRQKPVKEESESVQTVTRTTRRGVRELISGEAEDSKTATVPITPAAVSTRRRAPARKNMETQMKESKEEVKVEESMNQEKKSVPVTPAAVVPSGRRKVPAASTARKVNVKEESVIGRTYSTRRSTRLAVTVAEPSSVEKESEKLEKINSVSTQSFEEMLDDETSDCLNAVAEDSSFYESGVNTLVVDIESKSELLEVENEKASDVDTDMGTENTVAIAAKNNVLERSNNMEVAVIPSEIQNPSELNKIETDMGSEETITEVNDKTVSNNMEVDVIPSDIQNPSELNKLENVENVEIDMSSEETITEFAQTEDDDNIASEMENPSEESKLENLSLHEYMDSVDMASAEMDNEVVLDNKGGDDHPSAIKKSSETSEQEIVGTDDESENENLIEESKLGNLLHDDMDSVDMASAEMDNEVALDNKGGDDYPSAIEKSSETLENEIVGTDDESDADNLSEILKQKDFSTFEDMESDEKTIVVMGSVVLENNGEKLNEAGEIDGSLAEEPLVDDLETQDLKKIETVVLNSVEADVEIKNLEKNEYAAQNENQEEENFEFPVLCPIEDIDTGFANESVTNISADFSTFSLNSIPNSEVSSTPLKKSAAKTPSQARKMAIVSDDKENIDQSETKLQLTKGGVGMKTKKEDDQLLKESMRQLRKMLKEKLQITSKVNTNADESNNMAKVQKTARPALQTLSSNSLAADEMGN